MKAALGRFVAIVLLLIFGKPIPLSADEPQRIEITDFIPFGKEPVDYFAPTANDAVSRLQDRINAGKTKFDGSTLQGYLRSVLVELNVPVASQLLVYSKTARNPERIGPKTPRAIYFNDEVSVGWVPGALELELTACDPVRGITFYTLAQPEQETAALPAPKFQRKEQCLACHAGRSTLEVPGLLLRAFQTDGSGKPVMGYSVMNQEMPYEKRWGGWFVLGTPPGFSHRGNLLSNADNDRDKLEPDFRAALNDLSHVTRINEYATTSSDIIAHLVLAHQTHGLNLIARVGLEARFNRRSDAEDKLLRYLVFADEPPLPKPLDPEVIKRSAFREWFESQATATAAGTSLRQFELQSHVFKHRLSYLIQHPLFTGLPPSCRERLFKRFEAGFSQSPVPNGFEHLTTEERAALLEKLRSVKSHAAKANDK